MKHLVKIKLENYAGQNIFEINYGQTIKDLICLIREDIVKNTNKSLEEFLLVNKHQKTLVDSMPLRGDVTLWYKEKNDTN